MTKMVSGNARASNGDPVDFVLVFDWETGKAVETLIPDSTGQWEFAAPVTANYGFTYVADGNRPVTHGPYLLEAEGTGVHPQDMNFESTGNINYLTIFSNEVIFHTTNQNWHKAKGNVARDADSGDWYFEIILARLNGTLGTAHVFGIAKEGTATTSSSGNANNAGAGGRVQWRPPGTVSAGMSTSTNWTTYSDSFAVGDILGCSIKKVGGGAEVRFYKNGADLGVAYTHPDSSQKFEPHICHWGGSSTKAEWVFPTQVIHLPQGFSPWTLST